MQRARLRQSALDVDDIVSSYHDHLAQNYQQGQQNSQPYDDGPVDMQQMPNMSQMGMTPIVPPPLSSIVPRWQSSPRSSTHTGSRDSQDGVTKVKRPFKSYRLRGKYEKPWLSDPNMNKAKFNNWIVIFFIALGFALAALICWFSVQPYMQGPVSWMGYRQVCYCRCRTDFTNSTVWYLKITSVRLTPASGLTQLRRVARNYAGFLDMS